MTPDTLRERMQRITFNCDDMGKKQPEKWRLGQAQADRLKQAFKERLATWLPQPAAV